MGPISQETTPKALKMYFFDGGESADRPTQKMKWSTRHYLGRDHDAVSRDTRISKLKAKGFKFYRCKCEKYKKRAFPLTEPCDYRHFDKYLFKRHLLTHKKKNGPMGTFFVFIGLLKT